MGSASDATDLEVLVPRLAPDWDPTCCALSPEEGFLLSRIDGNTPWSQLRHIGGLPPADADRCLDRWLSEGFVVAGHCRVPAREKRPPPAVTADPMAGDAAFTPGVIEPGIDLPEDLQQRILDFDKGLDRPYHLILGVSLDADAREIKRAYFGLSKDFHPDRYFRREIGTFGERLERIFKKVVEAYELLSDPSTREELRRSMNASPPEGEAGEAGEPSELSRKRAVLDRLRNHFRIPEKILIERRYKARQFFQSAMIAARRENWKEAAASVKLAIAFDPWNDEYKGGFAKVQTEVHQIRAAELLVKAKDSWDDNSYTEALRLFEEVLHYRPTDAGVNDSAARTAAELNNFDKAREYAENACELEPDAGPYHRTLGVVLRRAGLKDKAIAAFETALRLDPSDAVAREQLEAIRRGRRRAG
jgi:curved DNA-binding protein CbpA